MRRAQDPASSLEDALRWLATNAEARPAELFTNAIEDPTSTPAANLELLVGPTASLPGGSPETRALAIWGLIIHEINRIGPSENSRNRVAVRAAFRLQRRAEIQEPWKPTLGGRFKQLKVLSSVFGNPDTTTPMNRAWTDGLTTRLVPNLQRWLSVLTDDGAGWTRFVELARQAELELAGEDTLAPDPSGSVSGYKQASEGAQPVFLDMFITTVFMRRRTAYRRITERLITAQVDGLDSYMATAMAGTTGRSPDVRALWGCRAEHLSSSEEGGESLTRMAFGSSLRRGEKHYFSSEAIDENLTAEREGVNVTIDHHGIAPGKLLYDLVPIGGLTIRIIFDDGHLPTGCWWHGELTERERNIAPPPGSPRWLRLRGNTTEHTFATRCQPRETYGISLRWPPPRDTRERGKEGL